jgi:23S rRNA pseudouridine2605 synthase
VSPAAGRLVRLQRFLADAGVASRRTAEDYVRDGRVQVNGQLVQALPAFVDPRDDVVLVDGHRVRIQPPEYFLVHKPAGVVCTDRDPAGRTRAVDLLPPLRAKLFIVGRLEAESTGLLLLTNDGELAQRLTHPRYGVPKTYRAEMRGTIPEDLPERLRRGVWLSEGRARVASAEVVHRGHDLSVLNITLREAKNRQIPRMLARFGLVVRKLKRVQIGPLSIRGLPVGAARRLTPPELAALRAAVESVGGQDKGRRPRVRGRARSAEARRPGTRARGVRRERRTDAS